MNKKLLLFSCMMAIMNSIHGAESQTQQAALNKIAIKTAIEKLINDNNITNLEQWNLFFSPRDRALEENQALITQITDLQKELKNRRTRINELSDSNTLHQKTFQSNENARISANNESERLENQVRQLQAQLAQVQAPQQNNQPADNHQELQAIIDALTQELNKEYQLNREAQNQTLLNEGRIESLQHELATIKLEETNGNDIIAQLLTKKNKELTIYKASLAGLVTIIIGLGVYYNQAAKKDDKAKDRKKLKDNKNLDSQTTPTK